MLVFAVTNLDMIIESVVDNILDSTDSYLKCINLIDIHLPAETH